jgi:hypothetical protein
MLRFGLIGTGYWAAAVHAPGIAAHPQAELAGVWGRNPVKAETLAARFGARAFSDVDELIESVEAVAFAVPPDIQAELAVRAAEAGRALLLEKPLALTVAAADRVVRAVRAPTVVFFTRRFDPGTGAWFRTEVDEHRWDGGSVRILGRSSSPGIRSASRSGGRSEAPSGTSARTRWRCSSRPWARSSRSRQSVGAATRYTSRCGMARAPPAV